MKMLCLKCGREGRKQAKAEGKTRDEFMAIGRAKAVKEIAVVTQFEKQLRRTKKDGTEVKRVVTFAKAQCPDCGTTCLVIVSNKPAN